VARGPRAATAERGDEEKHFPARMTPSRLHVEIAKAIEATSSMTTVWQGPHDAGPHHGVDLPRFRENWTYLAC
jgi:hypothetical protein